MAPNPTQEGTQNLSRYFFALTDLQVRIPLEETVAILILVFLIFCLKIPVEVVREKLDKNFYLVSLRGLSKFCPTARSLCISLQALLDFAQIYFFCQHDGVSYTRNFFKTIFFSPMRMRRTMACPSGPWSTPWATAPGRAP